MKNALLILLSMIILFSVQSCSDDEDNPIVNGDSDTTLTKDYFIYYPISQNEGWRPEHSGLFRDQYTSTAAAERLVTSSIIHCSKVGMNGYIAYLTDEFNPELVLRYPDGAEQKIIMPESPDQNSEYKLNLQPRPELSYDGTKLIYFARLQSHEDNSPDGRKQKMIILDLNIMMTAIYELSEFTNENLKDWNVEFAEAAGENILVNEDASEIWFSLRCYDYDNQEYTEVGSTVIKFDNGTFSRISNIHVQDIELLGVNIGSDKLFVKLGDEYKKLFGSETFSDISLPENSLHTYRQFALVDNHVVLWDEEGVSLWNANSETKIENKISWEDILVEDSDLHTKGTSHIAISPDGGMISFALHPKNDNQSYTLFSMRKTGELKQIVPFTPVGKPVMSFGFNN